MSKISTITKNAITKVFYHMVEKMQLNIAGMHCVSCATRIEKSLCSVPGVKEASVNFTTAKATIKGADLDHRALVKAVEKAGYQVSDHHHASSFKELLLALVCTIPIVFMPPAWIQFLLASIVQFWSGRTFYRLSGMDLLIAVGTTAAYGFSVAVMVFGLDAHLYFESSASIITLVLLGRWLEDKSKRKASEAIQKLLELQPKTALVSRDGVFVELPIEEMRVGDLFRVRPGENVAVDGKVVEGSSFVSEAMLTGESTPLAKKEGDLLFAATTNGDGSLTAEATKVGNDTVLAGVIRLVEQAQNSKAPIQKLADQISDIFVPVVIAISFLTFLGWWFFVGALSVALINAVAVLVVACPCALGLATPTVIVVASGRAAHFGILFKEAAALERAGHLEVLIFDKTGTLTEGKLVVERVEGDIVEVASALAAHSTHPVSKAIASYGKSQKTVTDFESLPGVGIKGVVEGKTYWLGSNKKDPSTALWDAEKTLGYFILGDTVRPHAKEAIEQLKQMGITPMILSGDHEEAVKKVAGEVGIQQFFAGLLPQDKLEKIKAIKQAGMVGDGINDAPALAAADVGFALGAGSDIAIESADITLIQNDLFAVVHATQLSRATRKKIKQNLFFAFFYNILGIPLAALGFLNPVIAAAAMAASSLSVVSNALLLSRWKP